MLEAPKKTLHLADIKPQPLTMLIILQAIDSEDDAANETNFQSSIATTTTAAAETTTSHLSYHQIYARPAFNRLAN